MSSGFNFKLAIFSGTSYDLSKFDFSPFELICIGLHEDRFREFILSNTSDEFKDSAFDVYKEILNDHYHPSVFDNHFFVFYSSKGIDDENVMERIRNCYRALLLAFPSSLFINYKFQYYGSQGKLNLPSYTEWHYMFFDFNELVLRSTDRHIPDVNTYLKVYSDRIANHSFINLTLDFYIWSFSSITSHESFISLVTCLEAIVEGREQLSFRLKRNVAVLLGIDRLSSEVIFTNLRDIYDLRSRIVHGDKVDSKKVNEFLPYLRSICSRVIIEEISCDLSKSDLNKELNAAGFGARGKLSQSYIDTIPNSLTFADSMNPHKSS